MPHHRPYFRNGWQSWERPGLGAGLPGLASSCKSGYPAQCRGKWSSVIQELSQAASGSLQPLRPGQRCWALGGQPIREGAASGGARCSVSDWVRSANGGTRIYLTTLSTEQPGLSLLASLVRQQLHLSDSDIALEEWGWMEITCTSWHLLYTI